MPRRYNTLGRRLLNLLLEENGGPRSRNMLEGYAKHHGHNARSFARTLDRLIAAGQIVMRGGKRGTTYARGKAAT